MIIKNKGYALELALGRHGVNCVSQLWDSLLYGELLLILLNHLVVLLADDRELHQLVLYMLTMMMQPLAFR